MQIFDRLLLASLRYKMLCPPKGKTSVSTSGLSSHPGLHIKPPEPRQHSIEAIIRLCFFSRLRANFWSQEYLSMMVREASEQKELFVEAKAVTLLYAAQIARRKSVAISREKMCVLGPANCCSLDDSLPKNRAITESSGSQQALDLISVVTQLSAQRGNCRHQFRRVAFSCVR